MTISQASIDALLGTCLETPEVVDPAPPVPAAPAERRVNSDNLKSIMNLSVPVTVSLAERKMEIESILRINVGTIVEFDVPVDSDLTLEVAGRPIGLGHAVKIGENFGLRITRITPMADRIDAMGPERSG